MKRVYEIYTKNPETGESGWDIKLVYASPDQISNYPNFDVIITTYDCPPSAFSDGEIINWF